MESVEDVIEEIRPSIRADGGDIELVGVDEGVVTVRLTGACRDCMGSEYTLKAGVERILKARVSGIREVVAE